MSAQPVDETEARHVPTGDELVQAIYDGRGDAVFEDLLLAMQQRLKVENAQVVWHFQWEGRTIDKRHLPLKVCRLFQTLTGQPYTVMHPANAEHARAIIAALLIAEGTDTADALERADNANGWEIANSLVEEVTPGNPFGGRSNGSSPPSPAAPGTGPRRSRSPKTLPTSAS